MSSPTAAVPLRTSAPAQARTLGAVPLATWGAVLAFVTLWVMLGVIVAPSARQHDFLNLYTGASLAADGQFATLHLPDTQLARERLYVPNVPELVPFVRMPAYALLLAPLSWLPFGTAFYAWLTVQTMLLLAVWWWGLRQFGPDSLVLSALFLPSALGIAHGQDCVVMLLIVAASYTLLKKDKEFAAGAILGLGLIKFHLFLLWPLAMLLNRRWRMIAGAAASSAGCLALSLLLAGWQGMVNYFALLRMKDLNRLSPSPELMINVHSLPIHLGAGGSWLDVALVALVVLLVAIACWNAPAWRWVAAASAGSLLAAPHVYGYDAALLLAPLLIAVHQPGVATRIRITAGILLTPIPFFMALAGSPWAAGTPVSLLLFLMALASLGRSDQPISTVGSITA